MRDAEVVASIVAGDPNGLATAYDRYADPLFKYCRTLLSDPADAADAVHDTFVIAASRLDGLRDPERLRSWLYTVARHEALRILRSAKGTSALDEAADVTDDAADVGEHAERAELKALFEEASAGLNPGEREVIELQLRQGLEAGEVAQVLGVSRNHAHSLLSRARDQLEVCLAVLLVGRAGRGECGELGSMLAGWDGKLTVLLRKRVARHIEHCATCTAKRAFELRPAMLLDLSPGAVLAAGAAASLKLAAGAPSALKGHTLALATGHGPAAAAHSAAVLAQAGSFGQGGFPRSAHGGAGWHGGAVKGLRRSPRGQAAVAASVVAVAAIAAAAFALTGHDEHFTPSAAPKPPASVPPPPASPAAEVTQKRPSATPSSSSAPAAPAAILAPAKPAASSTAASSTAPPPDTASPTPAPTTASPTTSPATASPTTPSPAAPTTTPATAPATTPASPAPPPSPPVSTAPATAAAGKLHVTPAARTLLVLPGPIGTPVRLHATGGNVTWSAVVSDDPGHLVTVTPAAGTLTTASPVTVVTVTVTVSQYVNCGTGTATACPTVTFAPGGAAFTVWTGDILSILFSSPGPSAAPLTPGRPPSGIAVPG